MTRLHHSPQLARGTLLIRQLSTFNSYGPQRTFTTTPYFGQQPTGKSAASPPLPPPPHPTTTTTQPALEIHYTDPKDAAHLLRTNPVYKTSFFSAVAAKPDVARAFRDLDTYLKQQGYADPHDPTHMPDAATRARMEHDPVLTEKSLLVQKLLRAHGIIRTVGQEEQERAVEQQWPDNINTVKPDRRRNVRIIDAALPADRSGRLIQPVQMSKPLQWFKSWFMTAKPSN
ncbi:hypothetical protein PhCBS80983_g00608 [Powellomyces hirtus]|uniref:Uncharacterized protein n=1 Tax=Powellomyces hirtus TaxID=109895 RepID=A0A507EFE8_9FUNG|nr:hypothetical protein PhCBS80983_g00608 [Powellomyces hirtus]